VGHNLSQKGPKYNQETLEIPYPCTFNPLAKKTIDLRLLQRQTATDSDREDAPPGRLIRIVDVFVQRTVLAANKARGYRIHRIER
jgi:hypothetical protein